MMSQIGKLAYKIELRTRTGNEDFMHDTNQYEFKMDGQNKGRGPRGVFQEATQVTAWGNKETVRPGTTVLLIDIEYSRVRDSSWMYLTSFVTI